MLADEVVEAPPFAWINLVDDIRHMEAEERRARDFAMVVVIGKAAAVGILHGSFATLIRGPDRLAAWAAVQAFNPPPRGLALRGAIPLPAFNPPRWRSGSGRV